MIERYFIMRHGASESNVAGKVQGTKDVALAVLGKQQASEAGDALRGHGITKIYTSPLQRALETGLIVGERLGLQISIVNDLRARGLGEWEGKARSEIKEMWSDLTHPFRSDPDFAPPGGESLREAEERTFAAIDRVLQQGSPQEVPLFVMHLIGTGALLHRLQGERVSFKNAEAWEIQPSTRSARSIVVPSGEMYPGQE